MGRGLGGMGGVLGGSLFEEGVILVGAILGAFLRVWAMFGG